MRLFDTLRRFCATDTLDMATRAPAPAKVFGTLDRPIFSPNCVIQGQDQADYLNYLRPLRPYTNFAATPFPTPIEYNSFRLAQSDPEAIEVCRHRRHPWSPSFVFAGHCPCCMLQIYARFLDVVRGRWDASTSSDAMTRDQFKKSWKYARLTLANLVCLLEVTAMAEKAYEESKSYCTEPDVRSAAKALAVFELLCKVDSSEYASAAELHTPKTKRKSPREVIFVPMSASKQSRPHKKFHRSNAAYKAGRHACPSPAGWLDTSSSRSWTRDAKKSDQPACDTDVDMSEAGNSEEAKCVSQEPEPPVGSEDDELGHWLFARESNMLP